ncbi:myelin-associated glycoprotein-like [Brienomyrus brachyistius]|uniref:myelin-associated glycoprotein-like n=1 Tax=Brienomyrus brachyistius TaxID=42636 RepID=UPI0020B43A3D|nr:myelin-associated glycoprotein-like [Brienomyrus brachyistius]
MGVNLRLLLLCFLLSGVRCADWSLWVPPHLDALEDSCLLIPCIFDFPDNYIGQLRKPAGGVWRKGSQWFVGSVDVFNSSSSRNLLRGEIIGDLLQKNCTTILDGLQQNYTDKYYFRIESGFMMTLPTEMRIQITDTPPKPWLSLVSAEAVMEGTLLNLSCMAPAPCPRLPPDLIWTPLLGDARRALVTNKDGTLTATSSLEFRASHLHHGVNISCTAAYARETNGSHIATTQSPPLTVFYSPRNTNATISAPNPLTEGDLVTLVCTSDGNPPVESYAWFCQQGDGAELLGFGQDFVFNVTPAHTGLYLCQAQNAHGSQNSSEIQLWVKGEETTIIGLWPAGLVALLLVLLLPGLALCLYRHRRSRESSSSVDMKDQKEKHSQVYVNMQSSVHSNAYLSSMNQSRQAKDEEIYENSIRFPDQSEDDIDNIYANSFAVDSLSTHCS